LGVKGYRFLPNNIPAITSTIWDLGANQFKRRKPSIIRKIAANNIPYLPVGFQNINGLFSGN
jgi:hypothetical protein